jgi:hypothetical protein
MAPALVVYTASDGVLADATRVEFQIMSAGTQLFPLLVDTRAEVNIEALCPDGDKLGTGMYVARWSPAADAPTGPYEIRWFVRMAAASGEHAFTNRFEVLGSSNGISAGAYALVSDLRDEGVTVEQASDARLQRLIDLASRYVDRATGRFFTPRRQSLRVDGRGGRALLLSQPIIAVRAVEIFPAVGFRGFSLPVDTDFLRVYNRHLTEDLILPDDRDNPRLEFFHSEDFYGEQPARWGFPRLDNLVWPSGPQTVLVDGVFGYTDPDGSPSGRTPDLIEHVTKLLVMRELPLLADADGREDAQRRFRIISEKTRDQSYTLEPLRGTGAFTGDPAIDTVLAGYCRPPDVGGA